MTTDRDFDRIAAAWLADGPEELSDRVIDAAVDQIHLTRQRRAITAPWRLPTMTTPARVAAAAVIGVLVFGGALFFLGRPGQSGVGGPPPSPSVRPTTVPSPSAAPSPYVMPPITSTFTSTLYRYSIAMSQAWTATPATTPWVGLDNSGSAVDSIAITGTDSEIDGASQSLTGISYSDWVAAYHASVTKNVPFGCDGGDPASWKTIQTVSGVGYYYELCNAAEAIVPYGPTVYVFTLANSTFESNRHMTLPQFLTLLETVRLGGDVGRGGVGT